MITKQNVRICCKNNKEIKEFAVGSTVGEIYEGFGFQLPYPAVSARVNNRSEGLSYRVYTNKDIEFLDVTDPSGMRTYVRTICFVLCKAVSELFPKAKMLLEHPISKGYFCKLEIGRPVEQKDIVAIKKHMSEMIAANMPIRWIHGYTTEAMEIFRKQGMQDKVDLLDSSGLLYATYYKLGEYADYFYGPLLPSTGHLALFDLVKYYDGILLRIPNAKNPFELGEMVKQEKMFEAFGEYLSWQNIMSLSNVGDLNGLCKKGYASDLINVAEALQEKRIVKIAECIHDRIQKKIPLRMVLISGPSSSGKTTFSKRLSVQLMANGLRPYAISLDDYFVERDRTPKDENGEFDYESLYALDLELFNTHLHSLLQGEKVTLPTYNFMTGKREYNGKALRMNDKMVLVLEGIHALNPELTKLIPEEQKYRVYVSALTTMSLDDHNWIPTTDTRLLRRIIRDFNYRGCSAMDTIARWPGVRAGEDKWIFPYQENADTMFNSALLFEFAVLRRFAEPILMTVPENASEFSEASRLLHFLRYFSPILDKDIPPTSLMREFLGGSSFRY